jgi:hypothetical protein
VRSETFDLAVCDLDAPGIRMPTFFFALRDEQPLLGKRLLFLNATEADELQFQGASLDLPFELDRLEEAAAAVLSTGRRISGATVLQV